MCYLQTRKEVVDVCICVTIISELGDWELCFLNKLKFVQGELSFYRPISGSVVSQSVKTACVY